MLVPAMDIDFTYWNSPEYYQEYVQSSVSSLFDNEYYIKQNNEDIYNLLVIKNSLKIDPEVELIEDSKTESAKDISGRISSILEDLNLSKSTAARFFDVSRPTLYSWIAGQNSSIRSSNLCKLEWLEAFSSNVPNDLKMKVSLYKNRKLGEKYETLEEIIINSKISAKEAAQLFVSSLESKQARKPFGSWKKDKNKGSIRHIPEAYSENG